MENVLFAHKTIGFAVYRQLLKIKSGAAAWLEVFMCVLMLLFIAIHSEQVHRNWTRWIKYAANCEKRRTKNQRIAERSMDYGYTMSISLHPYFLWIHRVSVCVLLGREWMMEETITLRLNYFELKHCDFVIKATVPTIFRNERKKTFLNH